MADQNRGLMVLLAIAAAAGVMLEMQRHQHAGPAPPASAPAVLASGAAATTVPPPQAATRPEIKSALALLSHEVKAGATDAKLPWALAQGLLAFGPHLQADDERPAVDVIASYAERKPMDGGSRYVFPAKKRDVLVETHPGLLVEAMLDAGVALDRKLVTADATQVTLARLVHDMQRAARMPASDAAWHEEAWTLRAWALDLARGDKSAARGSVDLDTLRAAALSRLSKDDQVVTRFHGDPAAAFDPGSPLRLARTKRTGIYGESSGGLDLVQAVIESVMQGGNATDKRRTRQ